VLGEGGMGVVFEAEEPRPRRRVALKVMKPLLAASEPARRRFLQEGQAAASVEHPRVVPIYRVDEANGVPFVVTRVLKREPLAARQKREGKLPPAEVLRLGREMAEGLAAAHAAGLIHRDVKPSNVWLREAPSPPTPLPQRGEGSPNLPPRTSVGEGGRGGEGRSVGVPDFGRARVTPGEGE